VNFVKFSSSFAYLRRLHLAAGLLWAMMLYFCAVGCGNDEFVHYSRYMLDSEVVVALYPTANMDHPANATTEHRCDAGEDGPARSFGVKEASPFGQQGLSICCWQKSAISTNPFASRARFVDGRQLRARPMLSRQTAPYAPSTSDGRKASVVEKRAEVHA